jgi:hypothetical protein
MTIANPLGVRARVGTNFLFEVLVSSIAQADSSWNLDVDLQNSCDDGETWNDIAHVQFHNPDPTKLPTSFVVPISTVAAGSASIASVADGTSTANTCVQGPVGDLFRIRYSQLEAKTYIGGLWSFQAFILADDPSEAKRLMRKRR